MRAKERLSLVDGDDENANNNAGADAEHEAGCAHVKLLLASFSSAVNAPPEPDAVA